MEERDQFKQKGADLQEKIEQMEEVQRNLEQMIHTKQEQNAIQDGAKNEVSVLVSHLLSICNNEQI